KEVVQSRRDDRVAFHARPTCHDFLGGWSLGRAGPGAGAGAGVGAGAWEQEGRLSDNGRGSTDPGARQGSFTRAPSSGTSSSSSASGQVAAPIGAGAGGVAPGSQPEGYRPVAGAVAAALPLSPPPPAPAPLPLPLPPVGKTVAVGFKSGECAVLDATRGNKSRLLVVLNSEGRACAGRVTAIRFVPGASTRLLVAAYSTGDVYAFDTNLTEEQPIG
ncbi:unnamed protein product, partial [Discosporangium mesarthrocarpum]